MDELIEFGRKHKWRRRLMSAAINISEQVRADWGEFCGAYDDSKFRWGKNAQESARLWGPTPLVLRSRR